MNTETNTEKPDSAATSGRVQRLVRSLDYEKETDRAALGAHVPIRNAKRQNSLVNTTKRMKMDERVRFINAGTLILDERVYYYSKSKFAKVKGNKTKYHMRGIQHFFDVFAK